MGHALPAVDAAGSESAPSGRGVGAPARTSAVRPGARTCRSSPRTATCRRSGWPTTSPFADPTSLLITPDHYVNRLLHAHGVQLADLGVGQGALDRAGVPARRSGSSVSTGAPTGARRCGSGSTRSWPTSSGSTVRPSAATADADLRPDRRPRSPPPEFRPRALYDRFGIEVLATTDDPCDDLAAHRLLADDPTWIGRVIPTFRPDRYLEAGACRAGTTDVDRLAEVVGHRHRRLRRLRRRPGEPPPLLQRPRRRVGRPQPRRRPDRSARAGGGRRTSTRWPARARSARAEATALRRHLVCEMARMSAEDGLVMTLHPAVRRNHHQPDVRARTAPTSAPTSRSGSSSPTPCGRC